MSSRGDYHVYQQGYSRFDENQKCFGKERGNEISSRLRSNNLSFNSAVEMLSALGYEVVIQERKPGVRRADQIVIDQKEDPKYDLDALLGSGGDGE